MRVHITRPAVADLEEIEAFISQDDVLASARLVEKLEERCLALGNHPHMGRKRDYIKPGLRTVSEGNYIICYRIQEEFVEILRVLHGARNIEAILEGISD
ncbi:MAG TPA: type II toxin-antitoxin system RelE/ParE family toxin [Candidatus Obscuribacterales bacterium]